QVGTTFCIYFPKAKESTALPAKPHPPLTIARGKEVVLLVEDSDEVRKLILDILEMQGYTVLAAHDGIEALEIASNTQQKIDVLLTDVMMPQIDGKQVADQLVDIMPHLKVIFMSGYSDQVIAKHGILETDMAFLQKPFTPTQLIHKIRQTLEEQGA
ncbi:MAG: response regulator, partial [Chloroflexota bacterium]